MGCWRSIVPNVTGMIAGAYYTKTFIDNNSGEFDLNPYYMVRVLVNLSIWDRFADRFLLRQRELREQWQR
jgi:hypothetical protein